LKGLITELVRVRQLGITVLSILFLIALPRLHCHHFCLKDDTKDKKIVHLVKLKTKTKKKLKLVAAAHFTGKFMSRNLPVFFIANNLKLFYEKTSTTVVMRSSSSILLLQQRPIRMTLLLKYVQSLKYLLKCV
jgi:hypothetical protein